MDVDAIIEALGGAAQVQALLGVGPSAVSNYRARGAFPERARTKIWQALKARNIAVDPETLEETGQGPRKSPPGPRVEPRARVLLIVTGGIAAYKALELIRRMRDRDWAVRAILTDGGAQFVTPLSVSALSGEKTYTDMFSLTDEAEMGHIRLARDADAVVVAPASADFIAKMAHGQADDLASTAVLATGAPVLVAPAMNPFMWANPATRGNVAVLRQRGLRFAGPGSGDMACGEEGPGRLEEPETIIKAVEGMLPGKGPLSGRAALVTSGPTHEPIDDVRYIANRSSGKQGHAIAATLARAGARVTLVSGPVREEPPAGVNTVAVTTAGEMLTASLAVLPCDIAVCAAAVADWAVSTPSGGKIRKTGGAPPNLDLTENPDILATISRHAMRPRLVVGFAAETDTVIAHATAKRARKGCDWILANDVGEGGVFGEDENEVHLVTAEGTDCWPRMSKTAVAERLADRIAEELANG